MSLPDHEDDDVGTPPWLYQILRELGMTANLEFVLDAADAASYPGSGQVWTDRIAARNFYLGSGSGTGSDDPSFVGTPGNRDARFEFDGGDFFSVAGGGVPTGIQAWHKDNAAFTVWAWVYLGANELSQVIVSTDGSTSTGTRVDIRSTNRLGVLVKSGAATPYSAEGGALEVTPLEWHMLSWACDEASGEFRSGVDDSFQVTSCTYASPSSSNSAGPLCIGRRGGSPSDFIAAGSRLGGVVAFTGVAKPDADAAEFFRRSKLRFGL